MTHRLLKWGMLWVLLTFFFPSALFPEVKPHMVITHPIESERGLFSVLDFVMGNLYLYLDQCKKKKNGLEHPDFTGLCVDFREKGLYYDPAHGSNYWSYYFEPIEIGNIKTPPKYHERLLKKKRIFFFEQEVFPAKQQHLIRQYLKVKPEILAEVNTFAQEYFQDFYVIGIHYRGTDKLKEAPRVEYPSVVAAVKQVISKTSGPARIFVATDEQQFLDFISEQFPGQVISVEGVDRSTDGLPIHRWRELNAYLSGRYALIDCLLLSRTDFLIRTSSNLSRWSIHFNPSLPSLELNQRYQRKKRK